VLKSAPVKSSTKTLLLWVVLIAVFVAIYGFLGKKDREPERLPQCETSTSTVLITWSVPALLLVGAVLWFRHWTRKYQPMNEGLRLLNEGRALAALEAFSKSREKNPDDPAHVYNVAVAQFRLWRLEAAMAELETAKTKQGAGQGSVAALLPSQEGLVLALLGLLPQAKAALERSQAKETVAVVLVARGIVAARERDWSQARQHLNAHEVKQLGGSLGALTRAIDALCVEQLTGERRHVDRIGLFGEASPDELRRHWPELIAFVDRAPAW
jgi:hypothetical protein